MSLFDLINKVAEGVVPGWVLKRKFLRDELRAYEAVQAGRLRNPFKTKSIGSPDAPIQQAGLSLIQQARWMEENHDIATGILDKLVDRIIGSGLSVTPMVMTKDGKKAEAYNTEISEIYSEWAESPEVTGELSEGMLDSLACRAWLRDGECFQRMLSGFTGGSRGPVPFAVQHLESDFCPLESDASKKIYQGVEKNGWKAPRAYYFYSEHPGNPYGEIGGAGTRRVPARFVLHPKFVRRWPQTRGVSLFHSVIPRLLEVKEYDDTERVAARVAAAMVFQVRRGPNSTKSTRVSNSSKQLDVSPGIIWENFGPDEWAELIAAERPNVNLEKYRDGQIRAGGMGVRLPSSDILNKYDGTYAAQRQELVVGWMGIQALRAAYVRMTVTRRWRFFLDMALLSGQLRPPGAADNINPRTLYKIDVRGPAMPWIDPLKEVQAGRASIAAGLSSRSQFIRERGGNPEEVMQQWLSELAMLKEAGVTLGTSGELVEDEEEKQAA